MKRILISSFLLITLINIGFAQTADEIVAKYLQTIGGADKWKKVTSMQMEGVVATPQGDIPVTMLQKAPNKMKMLLTFQGQEFIMNAFDGTTGWYKNPMQGGNNPTKMDAEQTKELSLEEFEDEFIDYKKKGHEVTLEGKEEVDGVVCYKIKLVKNKLNDKEDITEIHYFDAENNVPIMMKSYARSGPSKGTEMVTYLSDYQEVDGLLIAFFIEQKVAGNSVGKITLKKVSLNLVDDSTFAFPGK